MNRMKAKNESYRKDQNSFSRVENIVLGKLNVRLRKINELKT